MGPAEVFAAAGREIGRAAYRVTLATVSGRPITMSSGIVAETTRLGELRPRPRDTVLVGGGEEPAVTSATRDRALRRWLLDAAGVVRRLGSVCSGAFVLAGAGLLDGLRATTHWSACDQLARYRPQITVDPAAIFVRAGRIWTSAGVTTGIDMSLAMVEEDLGRAVADGVAARLVLYLRRPGFQSQFSETLVAQTESGDPLGGAITWARSHLARADVAGLARHAGLSPRTLHRRCRDLGTTPAKLLEKLRVEQARALLSGSALPAKTIAARCGFSSATQLKAAFRRALGVAPRDYRLLFDRRA
jgi:transcriptional regulator GlxA family with amidase domain